MAERAAATSPAQIRQGAFARAVAALTQGLVWLLLALIFSILMEWAGMLLRWPEQGVEHGRVLLAREVEGVVLAENLEALFRSVPPPLSLALDTTEKHERAERAAIMRERGCSELEAAYGVAERLAGATQ